MDMSIQDFRNSITLYKTVFNVKKNTKKMSDFISAEISKAKSPREVSEIIDKLTKDFDIYNDDFLEHLENANKSTSS